MAIHTPTLQLLRASILVALSGVFRIYIASLFLGIAPSRWTYLAGFLVIYATYTLDRALGCEEDKINKKELTSARKDIALVLCLISFLTGSFLFFREGLLLIAFLPFIIGYIYSKGIHIGRVSLKLKGNFGVKNLAVSLTWGVFISGVIQQWAGVQLALLFVFPFFAVKSFINTVIYDFRDVKGDAVAGIKTLPICFGDRKTRLLLQAMHNILHLWIAISMLLNFIKVETALLVPLWLAGIIYTRYYTRPSPENESKIRKITRDIFVDGEFILAVFIKTITGF
jgi:4-hydroxybenzoate polyprenyltransferase